MPPQASRRSRLAQAIISGESRLAHYPKGYGPRHAMRKMQARAL